MAAMRKRTGFARAVGRAAALPAMRSRRASGSEAARPATAGAYAAGGCIDFAQASARACIALGFTSSMCVPTLQAWPNGSRSLA